LGVKHIITSPIEHHAVEHVALELERTGAAQDPLAAPDARRQTGPRASGRTAEGTKATCSRFADARQQRTRHTQRPVAIGKLCRKYGALFHTDTVQTMGHYRFDLEQLPIDFLTCSAHKFHGPKGVGFLYMRSGSVLEAP
jgi:cysteine desulfurase